MSGAWKRKLAGKLILSPQINQLLIQSLKSWNEVAGLLNGNKKKKKPC